MDFTEKTLEVNEIYRGKIVYLHSDKVQLADGGTSRREVVEHSGGVAVLPVDGEGRAYCVRQYRYPVGEHLLEAPAGKLEAGEDPLECAVRELGEETGFTAENYVLLGSFYPSPGYCREKLYAYLATGLHRGEAHPDEGELLSVERYGLDELVSMVERCEIHDAKTIIAILRAKQYLDGRRQCE